MVKRDVVFEVPCRMAPSFIGGIVRGGGAGRRDGARVIFEFSKTMHGLERQRLESDVQSDGEMESKKLRPRRYYPPKIAPA